MQIDITACFDSYCEIAANTGVFRSQEIDILREILEDCQKTIPAHYIVFDERYDDGILGFLILGRAPMTDFSWDIYWLVVDKKKHGQGVGKKLLQRAEKFVSEGGKRAVLRVETSSKHEYSAARKFYLKNGFSESGRILHFYSEGDALVIFSKELSNQSSSSLPIA